MRLGPHLLALGVLAAVVIVGLLIAGSQRLAVRTFALDAPNQTPVAVLHPNATVCEGPVVSDGPARSVAIWAAPTAGPATATVDVEDATTHRVLASGPMQAPAGYGEWTARLAHSVPGGRPLSVCVREDANSLSLAGSPAVHPNVVMTGKPGGQEFSLLLLSDTGSLLSGLPTAFSRASLWRPSWVGSWTFWVLAVALLAAFGLGVTAVVSAAAADDRRDGPSIGDDDRDDDFPPPPDDRSEAGQNRPQAVA